MEKFQHALLVSLIVILGVIMYLKFIRNMKFKRLSQSFSVIEGYDRIDGKHIVTYSVSGGEESEMVLKDVGGKVLCNAKIAHETAGTFKTEFSIPRVNSEYVILNWNTRNQKISKKIYLEI